MPGLVQCLIFLIVLVLVMGAVSLGILFKFVVAVDEAVEAAPGMIDDYITSNIPDIMDGYIRRTMPELVQNTILALMMEMSNATAMGPDTGAGGAAAAPDERTAAHRSAWSGCGGVHSEPLCAAFKQTCASFAVCQRSRTRPACEVFVNDVAAACRINRCDVYEDQTLCDRVVYLCNNRVRATWDTHARDFMERELQALCAVVA